MKEKDFGNHGLFLTPFLFSRFHNCVVFHINLTEGTCSFFSVTTNQSLSTKEKSVLLSDLSRECAELLGKSEEYIMVRLNLGENLCFAGTDAPAAFGELFSIGLSDLETSPLSAHLCKLLGKKLTISADRIFLNFNDVPRDLWGWNGRTFADG